MATYHVTHSHSADNCYGPPNEDEELMALLKQVGTNTRENNVEIKFFKVNPSEHVFSLLLESENYSNIEKTIGQCKKTGDFTITPVIDHPFF